MWFSYLVSLSPFTLPPAPLDHILIQCSHSDLQTKFITLQNYSCDSPGLFGKLQTTIGNNTLHNSIVYGRPQNMCMYLFACVGRERAWVQTLQQRHIFLNGNCWNWQTEAWSFSALFCSCHVHITILDYILKFPSSKKRRFLWRKGTTSGSPLLIDLLFKKQTCILPFFQYTNKYNAVVTQPPYRKTCSATS